MSNFRLLISEEKKLMFLWTPKAGCTTAKNIFYNYIGVILPEPKSLVHQKKWRDIFGKVQTVFPENSKNYLKLQFCRDPYDRAVSSFLTHISHAQGKNKNLELCSDKFLNFKNFLYALEQNKISCWHCRYHSLKQFMTNNIDDFVKIENLENELKRINNLYNLNLKNISYENHSHRKKIKNNLFPQEYNKPYEEYLDAECVNLINKIYEKDIEFFKYSKK